MGYTTDLFGQFDVTPALKEEHRAYIKKFGDTRRMKRNKTAETLSDPAREDVKLPIGEEGAYFTGGTGFAGQDHDDSIVDYNEPPKGQPSLWCQWEPNEEGTAIQWDGSEKFYNYVEWIAYLIKHFLEPWGYTVNGQVQWQGEESTDMGEITINDNKVSVGEGEVIYNY